MALTVKKLTNRFDMYPDEEPVITWELRNRPDYVNGVDLRLYFSFPLTGRLFPDEVEKFKEKLEDSLKECFKDSVVAFMNNIEKVTDA